MKNEQLYSKLLQKMEEVSYVSPQNLSVLTPQYKKLTAPLKNRPWKVLLPFSLAASFALQSLVGSWSTKIVSVLQSAF